VPTAIAPVGGASVTLAVSNVVDDVDVRRVVVGVGLTDGGAIEPPGGAAITDSEDEEEETARPASINDELDGRRMTTRSGVE